MPADTLVRRRPGGRSARVRRSVVSATLQTLADVGAEKLTVATVAARAGVHETSIYRRWGTREKLITDALLSYSEQLLPVPDTGSLPGDLVAFAGEVAAYLATPLGRALAQTMAASQDDPSIAEARASFWQARYELASAMVHRAVERGEIAASSDPRVILEALVAPLHLRALLTAEAPEADLPARLAELVLDGALPRSR
jgi:AcrR family transcriptional regulator